MDSTHPFHHNLKTGSKGLSPEQELWYEFHIECVMRKLFHVEMSRDIDVETGFLPDEWTRITDLVISEKNADHNAP